MGEAKRRGSFEERKTQAIEKKNKERERMLKEFKLMPDNEKNDYLMFLKHNKKALKQFIKFFNIDNTDNSIKNVLGGVYCG